MFDGGSFKRIKKAEIGGVKFRDKLTAIWFELLDLAGKGNSCGMLVESPEIPFASLDDIAILIDREPDELELCMQFFIKNRMITVIDDVYMLTNWSKYQNQDGLERIREQTRKRVAKHRDNKRLLLESNVCQYCGGVAAGEDHILARSRGGTDDESNKVPCCIDCNRIKNDKPLVDFLNANRSRIRDDLVLGNEKLKKYVTLCNVTGRYIVTEGNATDIDIEEDKEEDKKVEKEIYKSVVDYLNTKTDSHYKSKTPKTQRLIEARLKEGFTLEDFKDVIDKKCDEWKGTEWEKFLRPETLFGTKFESYLNAKTTKKQEQPVVDEYDPLDGLF